MKYTFPTIENISQAKAAIGDSKEFIVAEKDGGYTVVNYVVAMPDTFPEVTDENSAIRRELRGMIFDTASGRTLHRRLHKFFNVNERPETLAAQIDFSQPHVILEKLDGSMITPVYIDGKFRWGTKMGVTDVALPVEQFVIQHREYTRLAEYEHLCNRTPIFEWCSRKQRIVIDYPEDQLVLIAIRENITGKYIPYEALVRWAKAAKIPVVQQYAGTAQNMQMLIDECKGLEQAEGFVIRFEDGHMVKVKGEWYLQLHKTKDAISREKNVIDLILTEHVDDIKPFLLEADKDRLVAYEKAFWHGVYETVAWLEQVYNVNRPRHETKKEFAVEFVQRDSDERIRPFMYAMWDGKQALDLVKDAIKKSIGTQTKVDENRWLWGNVVYDEQVVEE